MPMDAQTGGKSRVTELQEPPAQGIRMDLRYRKEAYLLKLNLD